MENTTADKAKDNASTNEGGKSQHSSRNKTPAQRRYGAGGGGGFPALYSMGQQRHDDMYRMNYTLDVDSHVLSARQNAPRVGGYYKSLISSRIAAGPSQASALLAAETSAIATVQAAKTKQAFM